MIVVADPSGLLAVFDRADPEHFAACRAADAATDSDHLRTALTVRVTYADLDLDLVDAVCVAVADRFDTDAVLTLDRRDFRAIRPLRRFSAFRLFPDDLVGSFQHSVRAELPEVRAQG